MTAALSENRGRDDNIDSGHLPEEGHDLLEGLLLEFKGDPLF